MRKVQKKIKTLTVWQNCACADSWSAALEIYQKYSFAYTYNNDVSEFDHNNHNLSFYMEALIILFLITQVKI